MATVTFFFADQAGSTVQLERLGDAGAKGVRQALIDMLRQAAEDHHGQVVDHTGDGLMICFDSAVDAVDCGVVVQQQAARHNARHPDTHALGVRVGIHTGEPLVNDEGRYFGVPVVVAARLCAAAEGGQVLVSDVTRALVAPRRAHGFTALGERALKGIAEPVPVAAVDWAPEETEFALPEPLAAAASGPLVGRAAELAWLEGLWEQAGGAGTTGRRRVALLAGDPGIGKTRLAAALARAVFERGGLVLYGRCDEEPTGPYQPLVEALGPYVAAVPRAELRQQLGPAGGVLTRVLPDLAERVPHLAGPARLEPETEPYLVAEAAEGFLVAVARAIPTLLVLDDLHWAEAATLLVVRQLTRGTAPAPLLVLGCYREPDVGRSRVLAEVGVDPRRPGPVQHRRLAGLLTPEVAQLLELVTGEAPPGTLVRTVDAETEGNPFFVHQLAGNLVERKLAQQVGRAARRAETTRLDLRGVREELVAGVLELQRLRDRPAGPGQGPEAEGHAGLPMEAPVEPDGTPPVPTAVPYKGLVRFEASDAGLFCGREGLVAQLVARLVAARFVAVIGPSGSGKSSLVRAGLLPTLAGGALPGSDTWLPVVLAPGPEPLWALAERLAPHLPGADPAAVAARLGNGPDALAQVAAEVLAGRAEPARLLLVVDQFEEVFTACRDEAVRRRFVDLLVAAATAHQGRCVVALALRADFYGRCAAHQELAAELADSQVLVGPMSEEELRRAVVTPARRVGCVVEPGLPETILQDVAAEPGALPLVSTALLETWERRRGRSLTLGAYAETGGVRGAVARLADGVYGGFNPAEQAVARGVFLRLTEPGEGVDDLRRRARREELGDDPATDKVLGVLVARRLVIADQDTVEVAHEALLREWPRLRAWLDEDREGRRLHRQLAQAAGDWVAHDRDPEQLYRGARLAAALDWARAHDPDLNQPERQFLDAGRAHHERQLRRARRTTAILAGLLVVALVAGALALVQRSTAQRNELAAASRGLAAEATARTGSQSDLAFLLAVEGFRRQDSIATRGGLLTTLGQSVRLTGFKQGFGNDLASVAVASDGSAIALGSRDGGLRFGDLRTGVFRTPPTKAHGGLFNLTFSPDGRLLATGGEDGRARLWDVTAAAPVGKPLPQQEAVRAIAFSPDGGKVYTLGDASLRVWAVPSGRPVGTPRFSLGQIPATSVAIAPDGRRAAVGTVAGPVWLLDMATGRRTHTLTSGLGRVMAVAFSRDGRQLVTGSQDGEVYRWEAASGRQLGPPLAGHEDVVVGLAFNAGGNTLATSSIDGRILLWAIRPKEPTIGPDGIVEDIGSGLRIGPPLTGHAGVVNYVAFTGDDELVSASTTEVATWDLQGAAFGEVLASAPFYDPVLSPDGRTLAAPSGDDVRLFDLPGRRLLATVEAPAGQRPSRAAFSPDGRLVAISRPRPEEGANEEEHLTTPWEILLADARTGREVGTIATGSEVIAALAFSPDGRLVAADNGDGRLNIWNVAQRRRQAGPLDVDPVPEPLQAVAFSPDGRTLAAGSGDGTLVLFDPATAQRLRAPLPGHVAEVEGLAYSPDGALLVSSSPDGTVIVRDGRTHEPVGEPLAPGVGPIARIAFSRDGAMLAAASRTGLIALWDVQTRQLIGRPLAGHVPSAWGVALPDRDTLITAGDDGLVIWDLRPSSLVERACALAGRNLTRNEWQQFVGGDYRRTCPQWPEGG
jgi:WD40 repeat protein/class 3 adenylate cyclase/energy-coupling factor transporter ATP-binding protein EcfA2